MKTPKAEAGLEEIPTLECLELLRQHDLGRIALMAGEGPEIFPVTYVMRDTVVIFRTAPGTKLSYAPRSRVAFEIDGFDRETGSGWSVMVTGVAVDATESVDDFSWNARGAVVHPMAPGERRHRLAIAPDKITGRRFVRTDD